MDIHTATEIANKRGYDRCAKEVKPFIEKALTACCTAQNKKLTNQELLQILEEMRLDFVGVLDKLSTNMLVDDFCKD